MENTKNYNFFYIKENNKDNTAPLKVMITASLGEGLYNEEEVNEHIDKINQKNSAGKVILFKDDGETFWNVSTSSHEADKLDIGIKEDNYEKWDEVKSRALSISPQDLIVFCKSQENKLNKNSITATKKMN